MQTLPKPISSQRGTTLPVPPQAHVEREPVELVGETNRLGNFPSLCSKASSRRKGVCGQPLQSQIRVAGVIRLGCDGDATAHNLFVAYALARGPVVCVISRTSDASVHRPPLKHLRVLSNCPGRGLGFVRKLRVMSESTRAPGRLGLGSRSGSISEGRQSECANTRNRRRVTCFVD